MCQMRLVVEGKTVYCSKKTFAGNEKHLSMHCKKRKKEILVDCIEVYFNVETDIH